MTDPLYSLAYFSRNMIQGDPAAVDAEIAAILDVARVKNRAADITGALLFSGGCFAQVLEGPRNAVEDIFETIQNDSRHRDATILHLHAIETRSFANWSMAYAGTAEGMTERATAAAVLPSPEAIMAGAPGQSFLEVLSDYIRRDEKAALGR
jgi:hypothetical protein